MSKRIYIVTCDDGKTKEETMVRASSSSQAIRVVAEPMFKARVAGQDDILALAKTHHVKEA